MSHSLLKVKIWGEYACFTRPEMKVERVSYPIMTPSAARGILEAIFWKPEFAWQVREIWVLGPISYFSIIRNEVNKKASLKAAKSWQKKKTGGYFAESDRAQRHTLAIRDVAYCIRAEQVLKPHATDNIVKYRDQFRRRVNRGQFHHAPYLGCREFPAWFEPISDDEKPLENLSLDIGRILFDIDYDTQTQKALRPLFFDARIVNGVLSIPQEMYTKGGIKSCC